VKLSTRVALATLVIVALVLGAAGVATYDATRRSLLDRVDAQLHALGGAQIPTGALLAPQSAPPPSSVGALVRSDIVLALVAADGRVTVPPEARTEQPLPGIPTSLLARARRAPLSEASLATTRSSSGKEYRIAARRITADGAVLIVAIPLTDVNSTLDQLLGSLLIFGAVGLIVATTATLVAVRRSLRPLAEVAATADRIAAGDLSHRVARPGRPTTEAGRVATAINSMLERLEEAFVAQSASETRLRRFAADASHELRTPLTAIRGYAELFRHGAASRPDDLAMSMAHIEREATRMSRLVDDLLLLARLDEEPELTRVEIDLTELVDEAATAARAAHPDRAIAVTAAGPVITRGDSARLRQVVDNLLANAAAHTPAGTPIEVAVVRDGDLACVRVRDNGPGLPSGDVAIFDRFTRGDPSRSRDTGGAGLGLAIVAAIVHAHHGEVTAANAADGGAVFTVALPEANSLGDRVGASVAGGESGSLGEIADAGR
jgi:two-component system OmpR family sensor kinase